jgi:hypothetical protein
VITKLIVAIVLGMASVLAHAQTVSAPCRVPAFQRTSSPHAFTEAKMFVLNVGRDCGITIYGIGATRENPAQSLSTLREPAHGQLNLVPPRIAYTPAPGFAGEDMFEFEAVAQNSNNQPFQMMVRVRVIVTAP